MISVLFRILLPLFLGLSTAYAGMVIGSGAAAGGPDTWYGPTRNADSGFTGSTTASMQSVEVTTGGSATKLRAYLGSIDTGNANAKLAIYNDAGTSLLGSCTITGYTENALNECNIGSPPTLSSSTRYRLAVLPEGSAQIGYDNANSAFGFFQSGLTYAAFPPATLSGTDAADEDWAIQVYVD